MHEFITKFLKDGIFSLPCSLEKQMYADKHRHTEVIELEDDYFEGKLRCSSWTYKTYKQYKNQ